MVTIAILGSLAVGALLAVAAYCIYQNQIVIKTVGHLGVNQLTHKKNEAGRDGSGIGTPTPQR